MPVSYKSIEFPLFVPLYTFRSFFMLQYNYCFQCLYQYCILRTCGYYMTDYCLSRITRSKYLLYLPIVCCLLFKDKNNNEKV